MTKRNTADRLRAYRARHGLSQDELAAELGCCQATLTKLESGNTVPTLRIAHAVEQRCGIKAADWLQHTS